MKKIIFAAIASVAVSMSAQTTAYKLNLSLKNGEKVVYNVSDIESITFEKPGDATTQAAAIAVPSAADFKNSYVKKVMYQGKQVAEICLEYILATQAQAVVVYPMGDDGRADLTKGISSDGATVVWDKATNAATVGNSGETVTTIYVVDGALSLTAQGETQAASVVDDLLVDVRGSESNTYKIVKIGTQYWMAENLRATRYADGTPLTAYGETQMTEWTADKTGSYVSGLEPDWVKIAGHLYSGYVIENEKGIAPAGWAIPSVDDCEALKVAGGKYTVNFRDTREKMWDDIKAPANNITNFSAVACGHYTPVVGQGIREQATITYWWTNTRYYDTLTKADVYDFMRMACTSPTTNVGTSKAVKAGHVFSFGHSIRCIRK